MKKSKIIFAGIMLSSLMCFNAKSQSTNLPDGKGESASTHISFMKNDGQFSDQNDNLVPDVKYGYIHGILQGYASIDGRFSFVSFKKDSLPNDTISTDSLFRQDMTLVNSVEDEIFPVAADPVGYEVTEGIHNFYTAVCTSGVTDVHSYKRLIYEDVYSDIDYHVHSNQSGFKFYFEIKPGGDPADIRVLFEGHDLQSVTNAEVELFMGSLQVGLDNAIAYQIDAQNQAVPITAWTPGFIENSDGTVSFTTGSYNTSQTLVIQIGHPLLPAAPQGNSNHLQWSSFVSGGVTDEAFQVFNDELGNSYYAMSTNSPKFATIPGSAPYGTNLEAYAVKFDADGIAKYGVYIGGTDNEAFTCGVATANGNSYWGGTTNSYRVAGIIIHTNPGNTSGLVAGVDASGYLIGTPRFYGGEDNDYVRAIDHNGAGRICIVGESFSNGSSFPIQQVNSNSYLQSNFGGGLSDGFIAEFNDNLQGTNPPIVFSTRLGGSGNDDFTTVKYDGNNIVVGGVTSSSSSSTTCNVPAAGNLPLCNSTGALYSKPFVGGVTDYFVLSLGANRELTWSTHIGSTGNEGGVLSMTVDNTSNSIYLAGSTLYPGTYTSSSSGSGYNWMPSNNALNSNQQIALLKLQNKSSVAWSTMVGCDSNNSLHPSIALSNNFLFLTYNSQCHIAQSLSNYCTTPTSGSNEMAICDNNGDLWLRENSSGIVFSDTNNIAIVAFDTNNTLKWSTPYGGSDNQFTPSISYDYLFDRIYVGGSTLKGKSIPLKQLPSANSHYQTQIIASGVGGYIGRFAATLTNINVEEISTNKMKIKAFPNPSSSLLFIEIEGNKSIGYEMLNMQGQLIQTGTISKSNQSINVSTLSSGMYLINLKSFDQSGVVRFVKE